MPRLPEAFAKMRKKQSEIEKENSRRADENRKYEKEEEKDLFNKLLYNIEQYDEVIIDKVKIKLEIIEKENKVKVFFNKRHWLTFLVKRIRYYCHCENVCDCESSSSIHVDVQQHRKQKGYENFGCYFGCSRYGGKEDDANFASSMEQMLKDLESEERYG